MRHPVLRTIQRATRRLIVSVVALSLLSTPVTYRGGAEAAHAHTVFQLWADVRSGSFTHHAREGRHASPRPSDAPVAPSVDHAAMGHGAMTDHPETAAPEPEPNADTPAGAFPLPDGRAVEDGHVVDDGWRHLRWAPAGPSSVAAERVAADEDAPKVGTAFVPSVRGTVLALQAAVFMDVPETGAWVSRETLTPEGIILSPSFPPPRRAI